MNVLAIDYGTTNIGLAWMQVGVAVALPFGVIKTKDRNEQKNKLITLLKEERIDVLVVGLPMSAEGIEESKNEIRVKKFIDGLLKEYTIEVVYIDERFTSQQADNTPGNVSRDEQAAIIILEQYMYSKR